MERRRKKNSQQKNGVKELGGIGSVHLFQHS
jgi:hypothetical protein